MMQDGQRAGLDCLYRLFAEELTKYGLAICGNYDEVEECLHDFFVYLWDQRLKLNGISNPKAYLFISFKRRLIKQLEKNNKTVSFEAGSLPEASSSSPEEAWIKHETDKEYLIRLKLALEKLSDREREVIHLKYFEHHSNEDLSRVLDINYQSVRNLLYRAIQNLRKNL